jgi:predicted dehydrogenase
MTEKIRIGLVGTGLMGVEHIRNLKLHDDVEIVAIADPTASSLEEARAALGDAAPAVETYADAEDFARHARVDAVILSSPNHTHHAALQPLLATGAHILCEKPLCSRLEDALAIADQVARRSEVFWVGMEYRFMPPVARFIEEVHGGAIGRLVMLAMREHRFPFLRKVGDWNRFAENTGGTMVEKCCHFFDLMRRIVRAEPLRVFCSAGVDVNHLDELYDGRRPDIIDNAYAVVDFAGGVRAMLDLSMFAEGSESQEELAAVGETGKIEAFIPPGDLVFSPRVPRGEPKQIRRTRVAVEERVLAAGTHFGATYFEQRAFLDAIREGRPAEVTAEDGMRAVAMGWAAELSAREKRVVEMAELL